MRIETSARVPGFPLSRVAVRTIAIFIECLHLLSCELTANQVRIPSTECELAAILVKAWLAVRCRVVITAGFRHLLPFGGRIGPLDRQGEWRFVGVLVQRSLLKDQ